MSKDKRFFIEGIDLEGLQQIMDKSYLKAMEQIKEEIQSSIDPYAHIPEKLSTTEVKKYFSLSFILFLLPHASISDCQKKVPLHLKKSAFWYAR